MPDYRVCWSPAVHYWSFSKMCCHVEQTGVLTTLAMQTTLTVLPKFQYQK